MIDLIIDHFRNIGHLWRIADNWVRPNEKDVEKMLDRAAKELYDGAVGDRFEAHTTGLIIDKAESGFDVYMYVGNFE